MASQPKSFWGTLLGVLSSPLVQDKLLAIAKTKAVEAITVNLLKATGFKAWIVNLIIERVIEEGDEHLIEPAFRKVGYAGDYLEGAKIYKKVRDAKDVDEWLNAVNDV